MLKLQELYEKKVKKQLQDKFSYTNPMQIPGLKKISINIGVGSDAVADSKAVTHAANDLTLITGQKAVITYAKKSEASFKLRKGMAIGCKVTLRGKHMYEFLERLVYIALPRGRDFRGLSPKSFDGKGNYALGLKEQIVFPEIEYDKIDKIRGMDIVINTSAKTDEEARALLEAFNMPFVA